MLSASSSLKNPTFISKHPLTDVGDEQFCGLARNCYSKSPTVLFLFLSNTSVDNTNISPENSIYYLTVEGSKECVTGQRVGAQLYSYLGFLSFALFANREYMGILMLPRTVTSKISWEKKTSQDGRCCKCFKGFAAVIYEFARLVFSKFISLGGTIEMFLKHLMEKNYE